MFFFDCAFWLKIDSQLGDGIPIEEIPGDIIFTLFELHGRLSNVLKIFPVLRNPYTMDINQVTFSNSLIMGWNHYEILHCDCRTMYNQKKTFLYSTRA